MLRDKRGMTLLEILVSLTLLSIVALALIQSTLVATNANIVNELRDQAVLVGEERMNQLRNTPFTASDMLPTSPSVTEAPPVTRTIRSAVSVPFTINRKISQIDSNNRQVTLTVTWSYKNRQYQHMVSTILRSQ